MFAARCAIGLALLCACVAPAQEASEPASGRMWDNAIRAFESGDAAAPPPEGSVLFVGSSSIRLWDLKQCFPRLSALNRGFGGSQMSDVNHYARRIVLPYKPGAIVLYSGDNDIAFGKTPETVFEDYKQFFALVAEALPETRLIVLGVKPSRARWKHIEAQRALNRMIRERAAGLDQVIFIDTETPMLDEEGQPATTFYAADGLHLSAKGYELWAALVRPQVCTPEQLLGE